MNPLFLYLILFFLYDPLTTSLHGFKKSIIHGAIQQIKTSRTLSYLLIISGRMSSGHCLKKY